MTLDADHLERLATHLKRLLNAGELLDEDAEALLTRLEECRNCRDAGDLFGVRRCLGLMVLELERLATFGRLTSTDGREAFTTARLALRRLRTP